MLSNLLNIINSFLSPVENWLKQYRTYIGYFLIILALSSTYYLSDRNSIKESGGKAIFVLWIVLWIPIFARVFDLGIAKVLMPLRKELGILMGTLAIVHAVSFISPDPAILWTRDFWVTGGYPSAYAFGYAGFILTIPLLLTSNIWSMKRLWKYWKKLHRFAYIIILLIVIHVVLIQYFRGFEVWPVIILGLYFIGKILEWRWVSFGKSSRVITPPKWQKWLCIPCGYIYDPALGDEDSGIPAWTEFIDIPESWRCPECGMGKLDFVVYDESYTHLSSPASIVEKNSLNSTTLELVIETEEFFSSIPWQFMTFLWEDLSWRFIRCYSIVKQEGKRFTFLIKLSEKSRGSSILRELPLGGIIRIRWVSGAFSLQNTNAPKIFIATGTGIAPIYNMITTFFSQKVIRNEAEAVIPIPLKLYFSVSTLWDLFYVEKLRAIPDLDLHIHITREYIEGFEQGRVDIDTIDAPLEAEWYFCGNEKMIAEWKEKLEKRGYTKIYYEAF